MDLENRRPVSKNYKAGRSRSPSGLREFADYVVTGNLLGLKHRKQRGSATAGEAGCFQADTLWTRDTKVKRFTL